MILDVDIKKKLKEFNLDISFKTSEDGCLGILGSSGCGKSMTLKSIAGIVKPDSGHIKLEDLGTVLYDSTSRTDLRPQKRRVGYLFQNYALFPNMTVGENIMAGLNRASGVKYSSAEKKAIAKKMVERFRLDGLTDRYPAQLSGGQQQRVALARILAYEPRVLLLDEPFSAMDSFLREGLRLELAKVIRSYEGISIMVTHDRDEAYQLCERLMLLDSGRVIAAGKTREIFHNPGSVQAARLTGCRNISHIAKLGGTKVQALDWEGLIFTLAEEPGDNITSIGIRTHDMEMLTDGDAAALKNAGGMNLIPVEDPVVTEMPVEWYVTAKCGLWWKIEKDSHTHKAGDRIPRWLGIRPEAVMLLKD